jgi:hypothetical protein
MDRNDLGLLLASECCFTQASGLTTIKINKTMNKQPMAISMMRSFNSTAINVPRIAPKMEGTICQITFLGIVSLSSYTNFLLAMRDCNKVPIRLVALATVEGSPRKVSKEIVTTEPLPAIVLTAPAIPPATITRITSYHSKSMVYELIITGMTSINNSSFSLPSAGRKIPARVGVDNSNLISSLSKLPNISNKNLALNPISKSLPA